MDFCSAVFGIKKKKNLLIDAVVINKGLLQSLHSEYGDLGNLGNLGTEQISIKCGESRWECFYEVTTQMVAFVS